MKKKKKKLVGIFLKKNQQEKRKKGDEFLNWRDKKGEKKKQTLRPNIQRDRRFGPVSH